MRLREVERSLGDEGGKEVGLEPMRPMWVVTGMLAVVGFLHLMQVSMV